MKTKTIAVILLAALLLPSVALAQPVIGGGGTGEYRGLILKERGTTLGECQTLNLLTSLDAAKTGETCSITNLARAYVLNSYMTCDLTSDHTAALRTLVETTAAGRTIFVPSGCKVLLGSPGAGDWVAELPSNTTIECEDQTAGFVLARKACSSGSDTPGAACTADNQCHNGTCVADYPSGTAFAPTEASTYGVFGAAASSSNVGIKGCSIWTNNTSGASSDLGGNSKLYGYCDGAGGSDVTGEACIVTCDPASGALYGAPCTSGGCGAGTCTEYAGTCKTGGGACGSVPYATNFSNAGPGKINVIDFSNASYSKIANVNIYDHRRGDFTVKTGASGFVTDLKADGRTLLVPPIATWYAYTINASVTDGLILGAGTTATRAQASGWDTGITAAGYNVINDCVGGALGDASQTGWNGSTNLLIKDAGCIVRGFAGGGGLNCIRPAFGLGYNFLVSNAYCDGNIGAKFIISGSGNQYMGVRGAWGGKGAVVGLGDQRGRCTGGTGTRTGKVCVFGAGDDATIGCPTGGTCAASDDFPAGSAGHFIVGGGTLLHTDQSNVDFFRTPDSKRCTTGVDAGGPCTTDGDCATGLCRPLNFTQGSIRDVKFFYGAGTSTAINLNTSAIGVNPSSLVSGGGPSIMDWTVELDMSSDFAAGIKFPTMSRVCVGGSAAAYTSCTTDATCTGGGKCRGPVENFVASGNLAGVTTPLTNWDWSYGDVSRLYGLAPTDDQPSIVNLTAGEALTKGQLVSASAAANTTVIKTTTGNPERAIGVALATTLSGYTVRVATSGVATCTAQGTVTRGDLLKPSGTTSGSVATVSANTDLVIGSALETATNTTFKCLLGNNVAVQNTSATFPKFDKVETVSQSSGYGTGGFAAPCTSNTQLTSLTYTATSGRTIRLQANIPVDNESGGTRTARITLKRGGTTCDSGSPTQLTTTDVVTTNTANFVTASVGYTDTGQSGSVTYRICACSNSTGTVQSPAGVSLHLTEY